MVQRIFYSIAEAVEIFNGDRALVEELVEFHGLRLYYRLDSEKAFHQFDEDDFLDSLQCDGSHGLASWTYFKGTGDDATSYYLLDGWFELSRKDSQALLAEEMVPEPSPSSFKDGRRLGNFSRVNAACHAGKARFLAGDLADYLAPLELVPAEVPEEVRERPMATRERNNLLRIIAALAKECGIDLADGGKGALQIDAAVASAGFDGPKERTIRKVLADVRAVD